MTLRTTHAAENTTMGRPPAPRDRLEMTADQIRYTKAVFDATTERARTSIDRAELLADRPDLRYADYLIEDLPRREAHLDSVEQTYWQRYEASLQDADKADPFVPPYGVDSTIEYCRRVSEALDTDDTNKLRVLLDDPNLIPHDKPVIDDRLSSISRALEAADQVETWGASPFWPQAFRRAMADADARAKRHKAIVLARLQGLENQKKRLREKWARRHRAAVEAGLVDLRAEFDAALVAVDEAKAAIRSKAEVRSHIESRAALMLEEEIREAREAYEQAEWDHKQAEQHVLSQYQSALRTDYLSVNIADFAPPSQEDFRRQLDAARAELVRHWVKQNAGFVPDDEQATAIAAVNGNIVVTARAGSGKTSTLIARAAFLQRHCGVSPDELLLLAFNVAAAEEMRGRLKRLGCDIPHAMTFHALAYAIVRPEQAIIYDWPGGRRPERSRAIQQVVDEFLNRDDGLRDTIKSVMLSHFRDDWVTVMRSCADLPQAQELAFRRSLQYESLDGRFVRSFGEKARLMGRTRC
jgi:hypothetical protein